MMTAVVAQRDIATMARVLQRLHRLSEAETPSEEPPLVRTVLDDLESALGEFSAPTVEHVPLMAARLASVFRQLLILAQQVHPPMSPGLAGRTLRLIEEAAGGEHISDLGYVRRLALTVQDLLDHCCVGYPPRGGP
ncbi:DUF6415 family natural product biosynthesis protein [Streptomyces sp. CBMA29]|uniref:DUF6415 family natural product biosynthesis protein n=1 Tax=Streptomyces sp. CBMA29 TaxID=1896314 RepID=UPI00397FE30D